MRTIPDSPDFDHRMMRRSIDLAISARRAGNSPVGCVVTLGRQIVAEAGERSPAGPDPFAHAEILAVTDALGNVGRTKLSEATLYTTNEPCFLCSYAIREARISRVVFAVESPGIGGVTSNYAILTARDVDRWELPPETEKGFLASEYEQIRERN